MTSGKKLKEKGKTFGQFSSQVLIISWVKGVFLSYIWVWVKSFG